MLRKNNYYYILGVNEAASTDEIKKAYRKLMLKFHPDVSSNPLNVDHFEKVVEAYKVLSNISQRAEYNIGLGITTAKISNKMKSAAEQDNIGDNGKVSSFLNKLNFKFLNKIKEKIEPDTDAQFFNVSPEVLNLSPSELKDRLNQSTNKFVRSESLKALVLTVGRHSYKLIEKSFDDQSKEVKEVAIRAVGKLRIRQSIEKLIQMYFKSGTELRKAIIQSLGQLDLTKANEFILSCSFDDNEDIQLEALNTIKKHKLYIYVHQVKDLTYHKNPSIQQTAKAFVREAQNL